MRKTAKPEPRVKAEILFSRSAKWWHSPEDVEANRALLSIFKGKALPTRVWNCLVNHGLKSIEDIENLGTDLLKIPNFSKRSYEALREVVPSLPPLGKSAQKSQIGPEIEITDEMIEAGVEAYLGYREDSDATDTLYDRVASIYRAMRRAGADNRRNRTSG
jgi:hypothetical protein